MADALSYYSLDTYGALASIGTGFSLFSAPTKQREGWDMGAEDAGLTLEGLAQRLEALERENERMRSENAKLQEEVTELRDASTPREEEPLLESGRRVSRRQLLSKAGAAAAGLVVAGALTQRDIREARADSPPEAFLSNAANTPAVLGTNTGGGAGVKGDSGPNGAPSHGAVEGSNNSGSGYGVWGNANNVGIYGTGFLGVHGEGSHTGVLAISKPGSTTNQGAGIQASHTSQGPGVLADSEGGPGLQARSFGGTSGAVYGKHSAQGYGGLFEGGRAQLKLVPGDTAGRPSGAHTKGEIYMDSKAALFVCVKGGTPGAWRKVSTTAV